MANEISIKTAATINAAAKYTNVIFNILAGAILSRILSAEDYGVVAVVTVFSAFFSLLSDMGLGTGVIQNKTLSKEDTDNIFSCTVYVGIVLTVVFALFSFPLSIFYGDKVYISIGCLLSLSLLFSTMNMIPNALMMKNKRFVLVAIRTVVSVVTSYILAIVMAFMGFKYYSLVAQSICSAMINFFWNFHGSGLKFKIRFKFESVKKILSYSSYQFVYSIFTYIGRNVDSLLTGKFMGSASLGYYNKAYNLMLYPVTYLTSVISPVLHPILSEHQDDPHYIYQQYMKVFKMLSVMGVYITVFCFFCSREIVLILYGSNWTESISCITVLSLSIWLQMTSSSCPGIYQSLGRTDLMFRSSVIYVSITVALIAAGIVTGDIVMLSSFVAISFIFKFVIEFYMLIKRAFGVSLVRFYKELIPELIMFVAMFALMEMLSFVEIENVVLSALFRGIISLPVYIVLLILTKQFKYIALIIPKKIRGKLNI